MLLNDYVKFDQYTPALDVTTLASSWTRIAFLSHIGLEEVATARR